MILEYHRPNNIDEAMKLLGRDFPVTIPLAGGNQISRKQDKNFAVVDLQYLELNKILTDGSTIYIGAMATLEDLFEDPKIPEALKKAIHLDATLNTRNTATVGGTIAAGTGGSALLTALLAMDTRLEWLPGHVLQNLGEFISLKDKIRPEKLIVGVQISMQAQVEMDTVGRSPLDSPILIVAISRWPSGRTRLALGGKVKKPILAMDGTTLDGILDSGINACSHLSNQWVSETYLKDTTQKLIKRMIKA